MTGLFYKIFGFSFDALQIYEKSDTGFNNWVDARKEINHTINELVLQHLQKVHAQAQQNSFSQQFYLDTINGVIKKHYNRRLKIYNTVKHKQLFCLVSLVFAWGELVNRFFTALYKFRFDFVLETGFSFDEATVCIGFPNHSFSFEKEAGYEHPRSFAEFLMSNKSSEGEYKNILSLDEFERRSKKHEQGELNEHTFPDSYNRQRIVLVRKKHSMQKSLSLIFAKRKEFRSRVEKPNLFLSTEYFAQSYTERRYLSFFEQLVKKNTSIHKIYVVSFWDLGLLKYGSVYDQLISVFSYSQNLFVPPAKKISQCLLEENVNINAKEILDECELSVLSFYTHNPVGFTDYCFIINHFKSVINKEFGLSLPFTTTRASGVPVNVGYESFTVVDTSDGIKNILVFDVPIEKEEKDIGRTIIGDKTAKEDFMQSFYNDIVSLSEKYNCRIILKPKYSLSSPEFPASYKSLIQEVTEKTGDRFLVLDPYTVIKTSGKKIELSINFPFTSTYYSMADACKQSVYYVPSSYEKNFLHGAQTKLVLGKEQLENIIKYL